MGWFSSWIATQGGEAGELLEHLGLEETGVEVFPPDGKFSWAQFPNQWIVVFSQDFDWGNPDRVRELSRIGLTLGCQFEDKVEMTSLLFAARDGEELWRVFHNAVGSTYRLDVTGEPPSELWAIRDRIFQEQDSNGGETAGVDYIHDIPFELAKVVCGYRHDEDETPFKELRRARDAGRDQGRRKSGLLGRLLGVLTQQS